MLMKIIFVCVLKQIHSSTGLASVSSNFFSINLGNLNVLNDSKQFIKDKMMKGMRIEARHSDRNTDIKYTKQSTPRHK